MNRSPDDNYSQQIKALRARLGLTQMALAEALGVSFPSVNRWENGKAIPSQLGWDKLLRLAGEAEETFDDPEIKEAPSDPPILEFTARPDAVRTLAEGERLSYGHMSNPVFATETSSIDPLPHQRIAVYDQMLKQPRLRFLLADDAGAGKTVMSGLYIREMLSRRLIRRILIVAPAGLIGNWQRELSTLFSLSFTIIRGSDVKTRNPFVGPGSDRLIVSVDTMAGTKVFARLQDEAIEPYDLVVIDEAHKLACNRGNDLRIRKTDRYKLAEAIAGVHTGDMEWALPWQAHHLLLLTATPHMGKDYPYYALWKLLEPEVLTTIEAFDQFPTELRKHYFIRRTKEEMLHLNGTPLYPTRIADTLGYSLTQGEVSEQRLYDETTEYLKYVYNRAKLLNQSAARLVMSVFQRRLASSTYALQCSFKRRIEKLNQIIDDVQHGTITIEQLLTLQRRINEEDDVFEAKGADEEWTENGQEENEVVEDRLLRGVIASSLADLVAERQQVENLLPLATQIYESGQESKFDKLREVISDPKYYGEKFIFFTEHRDTLDFLVRRLSGLGYTGQLAMIHGGMDYLVRQEQVELFRKSLDAGGARFMVCTDAAAEGINLQFCWLMINYDVPWNPARLEQRMGRIHRYGQKHDPVIILNLVAPSTREGRVIKTLLDKLEIIRQQLSSDKVFDSIGRIFSDISIKNYMEMALEGNLEEVTRELDGILTKEKVQGIAERERGLYGDGGDVARELPRLRESIAQETYCRLLPGYVGNYIASAAPLVGMEIEGDFSGQFSLRSVQQSATDPLFATLESYPEHQRNCLTVVRPSDREACIWMHPGEPVFETFRELVHSRLGREALTGAVFVDPTATAPYLYHLARLTVVRKADPEIAELAQEETIECRLIGVRQSEGAEITECPVEHLLLLRGGYGLPPEGQRLAAAAARQKVMAEAFLTERISRSMAVQRRNSLLESLPEREGFINRGVDFQESDLATARAKLSPKAREGNKAAAQHLSEIKEQQKALSGRRERALTVLRREPELIVPGDVEFIAHALVVPSREQADIERHQNNVEQIAMDLVRAYEEAAGSIVRYIHTPELARAAGLPSNPGFDILSIQPDGTRRCIEVKGLSAIGAVEVTENEWARACNLRSEYWLYVVYHCATPAPQMVRVQDPFEKLLVRPFTKTQTTEKTIRSTREVSGVWIGHTQVMEAGEM